MWVIKLIIIKIIVFVGLIVNTVIDAKKRQISLVVTALIGICGLCWRILDASLFTTDVLLGLVPGLLWFIMAKATNESLGYGDAWVLIAAGFVLGGSDMLLMCSVAIFIAGICALVLLTVFRKGRKYQMPFMPFLMAGYICVCAMQLA